MPPSWPSSIAHIECHRLQGARAKEEQKKKAAVSNANTVTQDFLVFSQPIVHEGALLSSSESGRRLYIHHLSEVPVSEDFTTRSGNHLHRVDKRTVTLAGSISLDVGPSAPLVPSVKMMLAIPARTFTGPVATRDQKVLELLSSGKSANAAEDFATACACFEAAYALSVRAGMVVSAANMRLKLAHEHEEELPTALAMYQKVRKEPALELSPAPNPNH